MVSSFNNRTRRPGEHRSSAAIRERILETAFEVISKYGYSGTTMAKVASKESKDLLLTALIEVSFERWHAEMAQRSKPSPGESFEDHVRRVFGTSSASPKYFAADFWRLGVILSVEKSVPEQVARKRFLKIREQLREELTSWWEETLPRRALESTPELPANLSAFALALQDGNAIAGTSGESLNDFQRMLATCLIHLAEQSVCGEFRDKKSRSRAASRTS